MDFDQTYATIYYLVVLSSYSIARAMQEVPYRAMVPDVATTYKQRSQVAWMQVEATHCIGLWLFVVVCGCCGCWVGVVVLVLFGICLGDSRSDGSRPKLEFVCSC